MFDIEELGERIEKKEDIVKCPVKRCKTKVKKMDNDWEKRINRVYVGRYNEDYCPYCDKEINI